VVLFVIVICLFPGQAAAAKTVLAFISDSPTSTSAYWVAKDSGIFAKHGLDVELVYISGSTRSIQSLLAGDVAFAGSQGVAAVNGRLAGGDVVIIDSLTNVLPYYIVGKRDIKSPEGLRGKTAAVNIPGTAADFALRLALRRIGISYNEIKAITIMGAGARIAAVMSGQVDFTIGPEAEKIRAQQGGLEVIMDMAKLNIPFQLTCTVTTRRLTKEDPKRVRAMVQSMAETVHYYKTHKTEVIRIMQKYTRGQNAAFLEKTYEAYKTLLVGDTYPTLEGLKNILQIQALTDSRAVKAKPEDFFDFRFVDELKQSGFLDRLYSRH
jgi:NitT/TauT family transport system substrate-binding protein